MVDHPILTGVNVEEYVNCDANEQTSSNVQDVPVVGDEQEEENVEDIELNDSDDEFINSQTAILYVNHLLKYACNHNNGILINHFIKASSELCNVKLNDLKQPTIFKYFKP